MTPFNVNDCSQNIDSIHLLCGRQILSDLSSPARNEQAPGDIYAYFRRPPSWLVSCSFGTARKMGRMPIDLAAIVGPAYHLFIPWGPPGRKIEFKMAAFSTIAPASQLLASRDDWPSPQIPAGTSPGTRIHQEQCSLETS